MPSLKILDPQQSQGLAALVAAVCVVVSWSYAYQPAVQAYRRDQREVSRLQDEVGAVQQMIVAAGGQAAWLRHHGRRLARLTRRIPGQAELPKVLNQLVDALKSGKVQLDDVQQGNVEPVLEEGGAPLTIDGLPCLRLPVLVSLQGRYHRVIEVLRRLQDVSFPGLVAVERAEFIRQDSKTTTLQANVQLAVYVVERTSVTVP